MPMFPLLSLLCAYTIVTLKERTDSLSEDFSKAFRGAVAVICGLVWFSFSYFYPALVPSKFGPVIWGRQTRDAFLTETVRNYSVFKHINNELPPDARLVFFWDNRGFFCERPKIGDSVLEAPSMIELVHEAGTAEAFSAMLRERGFTHVYFNELFYTWFPPHTVSKKDRDRFDRDFEEFRRFLEEYCDPLSTGDWATVYVLRE
jgi:hypothetical protein